jgi:hypothetical protein
LVKNFNPVQINFLTIEYDLYSMPFFYFLLLKK